MLALALLCDHVNSLVTRIPLHVSCCHHIAIFPRCFTTYVLSRSAGSTAYGVSIGTLCILQLIRELMVLGLISLGLFVVEQSDVRNTRQRCA